jgi:3-hydroxyisobutyrate dehydrogenase-like beta-hydroxyacid dehydrogenase
MRIAVVGTGRMGAAMAGRIAGAGHDVVLWNRSEGPARQVADRTGAQVAATAREAASAAEVCVVSLADDAAVRAAYDGPDGLVAGLTAGTVVCETSTVHPDTVRRLEPAVAERGAVLLDCPVSGSVPVVERGGLSVMVGGDAAALERVRPALEPIATQVFHLGDSGAGAVMKLVVNDLVHALDVALSEALVLAERAGIDRERAYEVIASSAVGAPFVQYKQQAFLHPEEAPVAFSLDLVHKDLQLIARLAAEVGARMDQAAANLALVGEAVEAGRGGEDMSALAEHLR